MWKAGEAERKKAVEPCRKFGEPRRKTYIEVRWKSGRKTNRS